jgi:protein TonB
MALKKSRSADIKSTYRVKVQVGLILTLALLILAFRWPTGGKQIEVFEMEEQEMIEMEEVVQTQQIERPPPPPKPPQPIEVPDEQEIEEIDLDLSADLDLDAAPDLPPPPPPPPSAPAVEEEPEPEIFLIVEQQPEMIPNMQEGLRKLQESITYPEIAKRAGVEGRVIVQFVVDEQGNVVDPFVVRGIGAGCDEEAVKAVRKVKFTPGKQRGRPVKVQMTLPVTFRLR